MSEFRAYLRAERRFLRWCIRLSLAVCRAFIGAVKCVVRAARRRFSLVFVAHDDKPMRQVSFSVGSVCAMAAVFVSALILVPLAGASASGKRTELADLSSRLDGTRGQLESLRREINSLSSSSKDIRRTLVKIDEALPTDPDHQTGSSKAAFFSFLGFSGFHRGADSEYNVLESLRLSLESSTENLTEAGHAVKNMRESLETVPVRWPIQSGAGHVSMAFGNNPNPFTGSMYLHRGVDISTYGYGDPIIATADGVVLSASYDTESGYGNNVIIQHHYGYITRYGHMQSYRVRAGQTVHQGDIIGYVGSTGRSTGPHVHYEMLLGPRLLDPVPMMLSPSRG